MFISVLLLLKLQRIRLKPAGAGWRLCRGEGRRAWTQPLRPVPASLPLSVPPAPGAEEGRCRDSHPAVCTARGPGWLSHLPPPPRESPDLWRGFGRHGWGTSDPGLGWPTESARQLADAHGPQPRQPLCAHGKNALRGFRLPPRASALPATPGPPGSPPDCQQLWAGPRFLQAPGSGWWLTDAQCCPSCQVPAGTGALAEPIPGSALSLSPSFLGNPRAAGLQEPPPTQVHRVSFPSCCSCTAARAGQRTGPQSQRLNVPSQATRPVKPFCPTWKTQLFPRIVTLGAAAVPLPLPWDPRLKSNRQKGGCWPSPTIVPEVEVTGSPGPGLPSRPPPQSTAVRALPPAPSPAASDRGAGRLDLRSWPSSQAALPSRMCCSLACVL